MDLRTLDRRRVAGLAQRYHSEGMLHLGGVTLPPVFEPSRTDLVFLEVEAGCEVYLDAGVRYHGPNALWRERMATPPAPGGSRRVLEGQPDFNAAMQVFCTALDIAPVPDAQEPGEEPERAEDENPALRDLVALSRVLPARPAFVGRERALRALMTNLLRETKPGVVVLGSAGVGKTTLVHMLAAEIAWSDALPADLADVPVYDLPLGALLEDVRVVGDLERRLRELLDRPGRPVFFLDEIHQLLRPELAPLRDLLKPALADGAVRVIGASTTVEWGRVRDKAFTRRFLELRLEEPSARETHRMLAPRVRGLGEHHGLAFRDPVVREAVMLADRYLPGRTFPDKAIDLLDHAAALQRSQASAQRSGTSRLRREALVEAAAAQSGLDPALLDPARSVRLVEQAVEALAASLHGQDLCFERIGATLRTRVAMGFVGWAEAVRSLHAGWDRRPLACFLACGPTGVGKTETARVLANTFFDGRLITLNGSDVGPEARHGVSMWTGSPPGFVGSDQGGVLTTGLRTHGTALILVDEVEKASPEAIQNVLLPLLGEGVVTDRNTGETLVAADCIVFCTSNVLPASEDTRRGAFGFAASDEASSERADEPLMRALGRRFRPEILGRFHAVLAYRPLDAATRWKILEDRLRALERQLGLGTRIELDVEARTLLEQAMGEQRSGARSIQDLVRERVLPLVVGVSPGQRVRITAQGGGLGRA